MFSGAIEALRDPQFRMQGGAVAHQVTRLGDRVSGPTVAGVGGAVQHRPERRPRTDRTAQQRQ
jgi:hypothetical protein